MIVFTATNLETRDVYVGTARESVEEEWANLLSQAENGTGGEFFDQLRELGSTGFEVDTWAYGESPSEARESMREAREELGAKPIKSSRSKPVVRKPAAQQSDSMKALMAAIQEAMTDDGSTDADDAFDGLLPEKSTAHVSAEAKVPQQKTESEKPSVPDSHSPVNDASPNVEIAPSKATEETVEESADTAPSNTDSSDEAKMMARLEAMKAAQAKLLREREQQRDQKVDLLPSSRPVQKAPEKPMKVASGRTNSSAKEKRIREAIETERERREQARNSRNRDEYDEMNALMARVEMRRIAAKRAKSEKSKADAAEKRKLERRKKAEAEAASHTAAPALSAVGIKTVSAESDAGRSIEVVAKSSKSSAAVAKTAQDKVANPSVSAKTLKLAAGRTGSSAKEKRIKEAIEQEKAERLARKSAQSAAEADEMAAILARLDERTKAAEKIKRRR